MPGVKRDTTIMGVTPKELYDVVVDYEAYPTFFKDFTGARILQRKDANVWIVEFKAKAVKEVSYTLEITHDPEKLTTRWTFIRGQVVSDSRGGWTFTETPGGARIDYEASIDVNVPLPGFVKRKIEDAVVNKSVATMFPALEREARRRRG